MAENDASLNAPPGLAGQVDFTDIQTAAAVVCERPNCSQQRFPPGTKLYFIPGRNSSHGRYICKECWNYYAEKLKNGELNLWQCACILDYSGHDVVLPCRRQERHHVLFTGHHRRTHERTYQVGRI